MCSGGGPKTPTCTSDGAQAGLQSGELDGLIELVAEVVDVLLPLVDELGLAVDVAVAVAAILAGVRPRERLLSRLQVGLEDAHVVKQRGRTGRLGVGLETLEGVVVHLPELVEDRDHGRDVGVVVGGLLELRDLGLGGRRGLDVGDDLLLLDAGGDDRQQHDDHDDGDEDDDHDQAEVVHDERGEFAHGSVPF